MAIIFDIGYSEKLAVILYNGNMKEYVHNTFIWTFYDVSMPRDNSEQEITATRVW